MNVDTAKVPTLDSPFVVETTIESGSTVPKRGMREQEGARHNVVLADSHRSVFFPRVVGEGEDSKSIETTLIRFDSGMDPSGQSARERPTDYLRERIWQQLSLCGLTE